MALIVAAFGAGCAERDASDACSLADCALARCIDDAVCASDAGVDASSDLGTLQDANAADADDFNPLCGAPLDVVIVLDVSTSMDPIILAVKAGLERLVARVQRLTADFQLGLVVFVDDALAVDGCAPLTPEQMSAQLQTWADFGITNVVDTTSINVDCSENSLDALSLAATACPWRETSTRVAIHVTDATFAQAPAILSDAVPVRSSYAEVVAELREREIRVGAFASDRYSTCEPAPVGAGFHGPYDGQASIPTATGGEVWDLIGLQPGAVLPLDMGEAMSELVERVYCLPY